MNRYGPFLILEHSRIYPHLRCQHGNPQIGLLESEGTLLEFPPVKVERSQTHKANTDYSKTQVGATTSTHNRICISSKPPH